MIAALFISILVCILIRLPIAVSLLLPSIVCLAVKGIPLDILLNRLASSVGESFVLIAVPMFILAGNIMNNGGITEKIFSFANVAVGWITGGLGHANILASVIFSGMSGTAIADTGGLGAIEMDAMRKAGYDEDFSCAITGASSVIGPVIPPSVPAVMYGVVGSVSIGSLFIAGIVPGLIMALAMGMFVYVQSRRRGYPRNPFPAFREMYTATRRAFFALLTPVIIISGIMSGVVTPTEAAVVAVMYAIILSIASRDIRIRDIPMFLSATLESTVGVMFIVAAASVFGTILTLERVPQTVAQIFASYITNKTAAILVINLVLLIIGTFMETVCAITILTPVLLPIAVSYGIDPVHFGIIMILNLMVGLLTPPVGLVLYVLTAISSLTFEQVVRAVIPYVAVLGIVVMAVSFVPAIALWLPRTLGY